QVVHKIDSAIKKHPRPSLKQLNADRPNGTESSSTKDNKRQSQAKKEAEKQLAGYKPRTFNQVADKLGELKHLWKDWLVSGNLSMVYSKPKQGKTRVYIRLIKTLWFAEQWPDGSPNEWPAGTKTLVIPYDRNHLEIAADMKALGIPDEAAVCP